MAGYFDGFSAAFGGGGKSLKKIKKKQEAAFEAADQADHQKFMSQSILDNVTVDAELEVPQFRRNKKLAKEVETMVSIFNNRKSEILSRKAQPGIAQTRLE